MDSPLVVRSSISTNPSDAAIALTPGASNWLWTVFAIMLVSDFAFIAWSFTRPLGTRTFHHLPVLILSTASIAYFTMASNLGCTPVRTEYGLAGGTRAIWYARYADWTITTPLLLLEVLLCSGLPLSEIVVVVFFDLVMIATGLFGALVPSSYKWGFYVLALFAFLYVWVVLVGSARQSAHLISREVGDAYTRSAMYLCNLWLLYPVCWGLAEGANVIHPSSEMIFYGMLDILAKPVFCAWHVTSLRNIPYDAFALSSGKISSGAGGTLSTGAFRAVEEKDRPADGTIASYSNGTSIIVSDTTGVSSQVGFKSTGDVKRHNGAYTNTSFTSTSSTSNKK